MLKKFIVFGLLVAGISSSVFAGVAATSGDVVLIAPPALLDYSSNTSYIGSLSITESNSATVFAERTHYSLPTFSGGNLLRYQPAVPGALTAAATTLEFPFATVLDSYILHFSPLGQTGHSLGSVTFDRDVVGFMAQFGNQPDVEAEFQRPGISLLNSSGLELSSTDDLSIYDRIWLSADLRTVTFDFNVNGATDDLRVFTAVPEPSTLLLMIAGGFMLAFRHSKYLRARRAS